MPEFNGTKVVWAPATLQQDTTGVTTATTMAAADGNGPLAPHMRPCAPCQRLEWIGDNPQANGYILGGVEGVYGPQCAPLFWQ